jgi:thimet oligopeptidase
MYRTAESPAYDPPFWSGHPDAGAFLRLQQERLDRARATIARLRQADGPRTVENTLEPFDGAVAGIDLVSAQAALIENVHPDAAVREAAEKASQRAASLGTELSLDRGVYDALVAVDVSGCDAETRHYLKRTLRDFRLSGVDRDDATRARIARLRDELVEIGQEFSRNIRSDLRTVTVADPAELEGLPADFVARHPADADGRITLSIDYPDAMPVFAYARSESLRRRMYLEFTNRAHPANMAVLERMLARRHELATLLGFPHWAEYVTADKMVEHAAAASEFVDRIVAVSGDRARRDYEVLLARKRRDVPDADVVHAWESAFWSERVRQSEYDFDAQAVRPYFPFARVKQGVLDVASRLFGVRFARIEDAPVWHPSVECWEMWDGDALAGRIYLDMHPRKDKYNHAAQFDLRTGMAGRHIPETALVCNFPGSDPGDPGLMEHGDVKTLFHEFGHLLHAVFGGRRRWVGVGGIRTEHDFVEVPSQLFEEWVWDPRVLATFARHHQTDEPIPADLVRQMRRASGFGKGLAVRRQMIYARLSLSLYDRDPAGLDTDVLIERITNDYQPFPYVPGTHLQCGFGHLEGYSAGYYTYMWSLVIAKDFFGRFRREDLLEPTVPAEYRRTVLEAGGSAPAADLVEAFLGRPFTFEAYRSWLEEGE